MVKIQKVSEVCEIIMGQSPSSDLYNDKKIGVPFFQGKSEFGEIYPTTKWYCSSPIRLAEANDILISVRAPVGDVNIANLQCCIGRGLAAIRPDQSKLNTKFLFYVLKSKKREIENMGTGSTFKAISKKDIANIQIPIPSINTQIKIVKILDNAQDLIYKRKAQIEALDQLTQSVFFEMFGDPISNSKGWDLSICKDVTKKIGSGATPKGGNASYKDEGISLIRSMNVYNNRFSYKDLAFIDEEQAAKLNNVTVCKNDILLNITGASVARSCIVPDDVLPARVNQHVSIIRVKDDLVNPIFISYMFTNEIYQKYLLQLSTSGGATREAITKQQIENLPIILPPLDIQEDFAYKVKQLEKQKSLIQASIEELENLYSSLMQKAFKGELFTEEKVSNL
jgi:type I restriction enzyme, S subunit